MNRTRKAANRSLPVTNCLGGHIDIKVIDELCRRHGYRGVFLSDDLELDQDVLT